MTVFINLDPISRQIVNAKNKRFVKELQSVGMREERIEQILTGDYHRNILSYPIFPEAKIIECKANYRSFSRTMGKITSLLRDKNISDAIIGPLQEEWKKLWALQYDQEWIAKLDSIKKYTGPKNPKSEKQMFGFQIYNLFEYLKPLMETLNKKQNYRGLYYRPQDIFKLIEELFSLGWPGKFRSWKQIKTMYGNAKRRKEPNPKKPIKKKTKVSTYEREKIEKTR